MKNIANEGFRGCNAELALRKRVRLYSRYTMISRPFFLTLLSTLLAAHVTIAQDSTPSPVAAEEKATAPATEETPKRDDAKPSPKADKPKSDKPKPEKPKVAPFEEVDADKDGGVTEEEFYTHVVTQTFVYHDKDNDQSVQEKEAKKHQKKVKAPAPDAAATPVPEGKKKKTKISALVVAIPFGDVDSNGNAALTKEELKAAVKDKQPQFQTVFQLLDANKDSKLTADEWTTYSDQQAKSGGGVPIFRFSF